MLKCKNFIKLLFVSITIASVSNFIPSIVHYDPPFRGSDTDTRGSN